jgi:predicted MPP superfamily phosphohydrolase
MKNKNLLNNLELILADTEVEENTSENYSGVTFEEICDIYTEDPELAYNVIKNTDVMILTGDNFDRTPEDYAKLGEVLELSKEISKILDINKYAIRIQYSVSTGIFILKNYITQNIYNNIPRLLELSYDSNNKKIIDFEIQFQTVKKHIQTYVIELDSIDEMLSLVQDLEHIYSKYKIL